MNNPKSAFLQIRVTPQEKRVIHADAQKAGLDMSAWVKQQLFSVKTRAYFDLLEGVMNPKISREALAHLNDFLWELSKKDFVSVVRDLPEAFKNTFQGNYIAAMVEMAAAQKDIPAPQWTQKYRGLKDPYFATDFKKLRLHLLVSSPPPFRKRNIFIDSSIGDRV